MRSIFRSLLVGGASAALVLGTAGLAGADTISTSSTDASYDAVTRTFTISVGQTATATLTYAADKTGKNGCDLTGKDSQVTFGVNTAGDPAVTGLLQSVQYTACPDEDTPPQTLTFTGVAAGTAVVSFDVDSVTAKDVTAAGFATEPATFTVVVLDPEDGRNAPAVANDYLHNAADEATLAACQDANGTNRDKSNWHGQLIAKVAQFFGDETFTEEEEHIVVAKVRELCGL
jgi:hypothetical protein